MVEDTLEVVKVVPQERVPERAVEHIVDIPASKVVEDTLDVVKFIHQENARRGADCLHSCVEQEG